MSKKTLIVSAIVVTIVIAFSSCSSSRKYGCGGGVNKRMTWNRMVDHINRP